MADWWNKSENKRRLTHHVKHGFKSDKELHEFCAKGLRKHVPDVAVCENHVAPFSWIADNFFGRVNDSFAWAGRGGGKTQNLAIMNLLDAVFNKEIEVAHVAAVKFQADEGLKHTKALFKVPPFDQLLSKNIQREAALINDSLIRILTGTTKGTNSPHPAKSRFDEVDLSEWSVLEEFFCMANSKPCERCMNMPPHVVKKCKECGGTGETTTAQVTLASTRKTMSGLMQRLLRDIEKGEREMKIYKWCVWESMQKCFENCSTCYLYNRGCGGKCRNSNGFQTVNDVIRLAKRVDKITWEAQFLGLKPDTEGLVYPMFNRDRHIDNDLSYNPNLPVMTSNDFGVSDPFVSILLQYDKSKDFIYVIDELQTNYGASAKYMQAMVDRERELGIPGVMYRVCDSSGLSWITEFSELGMNLIGVPGKIEEGVAEVRRRLDPAIGDATILINGNRCPNLIDQLERYEHMQLRSTGEILKGKIKEGQQDHAIDALRYGVLAIGRFGDSMDSHSIDSLSSSLPDFAQYPDEGGYNEAANLDLVYGRA